MPLPPHQERLSNPSPLPDPSSFPLPLRKMNPGEAQPFANTVAAIAQGAFSLPLLDREDAREVMRDLWLKGDRESLLSLATIALAQGTFGTLSDPETPSRPSESTTESRGLPSLDDLV